MSLRHRSHGQVRLAITRPTSSLTPFFFNPGRFCEVLPSCAPSVLPQTHSVRAASRTPITAFTKEEGKPESGDCNENAIEDPVPTGKPLASGLYLVGTPIGNLEDITLRALRVLREVSLVLVEDTRHSAKLLRHYGIHISMMSYHKFNAKSRRDTILERLHRQESVALISDAGMPAVSDPGAELVHACAAEGILVFPIPGPSAVVAAVSVSGFLGGTGFTFLGFLPEKPGKRLAKLREAAGREESQVLFVAPHKLLATLLSCQEAFGVGRQCVVARELTKLHEEHWRGTLSEAVVEFEKRNIKGEITLVIQGLGSYNLDKDSAPASEEELAERQAQIEETVLRAMEGGASASAAAKSVAHEMGMKKNEVYTVALELQEKVREKNGTAAEEEE